jgi:hypothetical protein
MKREAETMGVLRLCIAEHLTGSPSRRPDDDPTRWREKALHEGRQLFMEQTNSTQRDSTQFNSTQRTAPHGIQARLPVLVVVLVAVVLGATLWQRTLLGDISAFHRHPCRSRMPFKLMSSRHLLPVTQISPVTPFHNVCQILPSLLKEMKFGVYL